MKAYNITHVFKCQLDSDGVYASDCALFIQELTSMGVRTIEMGGRPGGKTMQAIGGTKGGLAYDFQLLQEDTRIAFVLGGADPSTNASNILPGAKPFPLDTLVTTSALL